MTPRSRIAVLVVVVVLAMAGGTAFVLVARQQQQAAAANAPAVATRTDLAGLRAEPHLIFRSTSLGAGYGQVAVVPLTQPDGPRAFTSVSCERVYAVASSAICLSADRGVVTTYHSQLLSTNWTVAQDLPLTGLPSRTRLSKDGKLAATTTFVFGDSYANPGQFSTRTLVSHLSTSTTKDLESFRLVIDGKTINAADRNLWGVTFADEDQFYATAATGGHTWLVRGSLAGSTLTAIHPDVECPSLSPDGTRIAYKKHGDRAPGKWRLAVLDLSTGRETLTAEPNSIDDQADWLDNDHIVYGLPRSTNGTATSDVWVVKADGSGTAQVLIHDAWSPSVVHVAKG